MSASETTMQTPPEGQAKPKKKKIVSQILSEDRQWVDARISKPKPGQKVVIRFSNPTLIFSETDTEILPSEDAKIGMWAQDVNDPNKGSWHICPPFPKYDYSPLSQKDRISDDAVVTHWAIPEEGELEGWETRFDQINLFKKLNLEVDEEHEADLYRALMWGAAFIQKGNPGDPHATYLATILYDLQYCIDKGHGIDLTDEEFEALVAERAAQQQERVDAEAGKYVAANEESKDDEPEDKAE